MVAKLSSVRVMSAAPLATSVPVMPMAQPMSAALSAGASFTPSPGHGNNLALALPRLDNANFVLGGHARVDRNGFNLPVQLGVGHRVQLRAGDGRVLLRHHAQLAGNGGGRDHMVAGNHDRLDAGLAANPGRLP